MSSDHINTSALQVGSGQPWRQQYDINLLQSGDIIGWKTGTPLPDVLSYSSVIVTKNRVYLLGGWNAKDVISTTYTANINEDGTLGEWTIGPSLPGKLAMSQAVIIKNRVYLLGGYILDALSVVYTTIINNDGTLGEWTTDTSLPGPLCLSSAIVTKNHIHLLGGVTINNYEFANHKLTNNNLTSTVYTATINEDGTLGEWTTGQPLPNALAYSSATVTKDRVYLLGGFDTYDVTSVVYTAPINDDGTLGKWVLDKPLPIQLGNTTTIVTKNRVYLFGSLVKSSVANLYAYTSNIKDDGTLEEWVATTPLPNKASQSQLIVTKNHIHMLGGSDSKFNIASAVFTASISGGLNDYSYYSTLELLDFLKESLAKSTTQ